MKINNTKFKPNLHIALEKLEKEDQQLLKLNDKQDNRTNTFLTMSLAIFTLQTSLLTNTLINTYKKYIITQYNIIIICILILFIADILFNINSILNFRRSSKISEKIYTNQTTTDEYINEKINEKVLIKQEIITYQDNIYENKEKIKYKKKLYNYRIKQYSN